jgi:hypothetical protein
LPGHLGAQGGDFGLGRIRNLAGVRRGRGGLMRIRTDLGRGPRSRACLLGKTRDSEGEGRQQRIGPAEASATPFRGPR